MVDVKRMSDEIKVEILNKKAQVESELKKLFEKYEVSSFSELEERFSDIPEEEGHDDYFTAHMLEEMRRKLCKLLETLEE